MSKKLLIILLIALVAASAGVYLAYRSVFKNAPLSVADEKADFTISAADLVRAFETDETKATQRYVGKVVQVRGEISSISVEETSITVVLQDPEELFGVLCTFDRSVEKPESFTEGEVITVKGICNGYLTDVMLNKCARIK